jgi:hypothetical protein
MDHEEWMESRRRINERVTAAREIDRERRNYANFTLVGVGWCSDRSSGNGDEETSRVEAAPAPELPTPVPEPETAPAPQLVMPHLAGTEFEGHYNEIMQAIAGGPNFASSVVIVPIKRRFRRDVVLALDLSNGAIIPVPGDFDTVREHSVESNVLRVGQDQYTLTEGVFVRLLPDPSEAQQSRPDGDADAGLKQRDIPVEGAGDNLRQEDNQDDLGPAHQAPTL